MDVSNNKISEIYDRSFQKTLNLQTLNLRKNRISKIAPKSFENLFQLRILDLSENLLESFPANIFGGDSFSSNRLRKINLSGNKLKGLDSELFGVLRNLMCLNLAHVSVEFINMCRVEFINMCRVESLIFPLTKF